MGPTGYIIGAVALIGGITYIRYRQRTHGLAGVSAEYLRSQISLARAQGNEAKAQAFEAQLAQLESSPAGAVGGGAGGAGAGVTGNSSSQGPAPTQTAPASLMNVLPGGDSEGPNYVGMVLFGGAAVVLIGGALWLTR